MLKLQQLAQESPIAMFPSDNRVTRTWQDNGLPSLGNFPLRAVKPTHAHHALILQGQIDQRFVEIRILIILPRQVGGVERQIRRPQGGLQLYDLFPVLGLITGEVITHEPSWSASELSFSERERPIAPFSG